MKTILKKADAETLKLLQQIDVTELEGIATSVLKTLKTALQGMVLSGDNFQTALETMAENSESLSRYAKTYVNTSRSTLSQKVTDLTAKNLKEEGGKVYYEYFGTPPDDVTRDECLIGLGETPSSSYPNAPYFTEAEKEQFQAEFGIRWNCRHEFALITERAYKDAVNGT